jgi:hypothetical protein
LLRGDTERKNRARENEQHDGCEFPNAMKHGRFPPVRADARFEGTI